MLHYTPNKRIADAGILTIGQNYFEIPPRKNEVIVTGQCNSLSVNGTVYITRALNHMHYLGKFIGHTTISKDLYQAGFVWFSWDFVF
jgi:hypothetical protein